MDRVRELINELETISPMLDEDDPRLTEELVERYCNILAELSQIFEPKGVHDEDEWIIKPVLASFGPGTTFGCAWMGCHLLEKFPSGVLRPHLYNSLQVGEVGEREWIAYLLGIQRDAADTFALIDALEDPSPGVRMKALKALSMIGNLEAKAAMEALLSDPADDVRKQAAHSIEALLDQRYVH